MALDWNLEIDPWIIFLDIFPLSTAFPKRKDWVHFYPSHRGFAKWQNNYKTKIKRFCDQVKNKPLVHKCYIRLSGGWGFIFTSSTCPSIVKSFAFESNTLSFHSFENHSYNTPEVSVCGRAPFYNSNSHWNMKWKREVRSSSTITWSVTLFWCSEGRQKVKTLHVFKKKKKTICKLQCHQGHVLSLVWHNSHTV